MLEPFWRVALAILAILVSTGCYIGMYAWGYTNGKDDHNIEQIDLPITKTCGPHMICE